MPLLAQPFLPPAAPVLGDGAYELKFLLPDPAVEPVIDWAHGRLPPDPHAGPDGTYRVHSLYLDTERFDVYHRVRGYRRSKYRIRRYGDEEVIHLERKRKRRGWVRKQRTTVSEAELDWLAGGAPAGWAGLWFRELVEERRLLPCCQVAYRRLALIGAAEGLVVRLTIDREIRCSAISSLSVREPWDHAGMLPSAILELKFQQTLPRMFKELIRRFALSPTPFSKYRCSVAVCVLPDGEQGG